MFRLKTHISPFFSLLQRNKCFCLVFVAAFFLRIYRIFQHSVWFDEWLFYVALPCETFWEYLRNLFIYVAEMAITPAYLALLYTSATLVSGNIPVIRAFSVVPGLISILLLYGLGCRLGGRRAGLIAALCLALSPQHIWHNQEIRPYSLLFMCCLMALWGLLKWRDNGFRRWFFLNYVFNGLLIFTHLFGVLFLLPQGLYLLGRKEYKVFVRWAAAQTVFVALLLIAILVKPHLSEAYHPDLGLSPFLLVARLFPALLLRSFCADVLRWHTGIWPWFESGTSPAVPSWLTAILGMRTFFDLALTLLILVCIALFALMGSRLRQKKSGSHEESSADKRAEWVLLLSIIFIPSVILATLTLLTSANFSDYGHDIYATIGIYTIIGLLLSRLPSRSFRTAVGVLVVLYGYQCLLFLPGSTRTDWRAGAAYVKENAAVEDIVLDLWWNGPMSRRLPYFSDSALEIRRANTLIAASDEAAQFFTQQKESAATASAWLLMETRFWKEWFPGIELIPLLAETLRSRGLTCDIREFPGGFNMAVARIRPSSEWQNHPVTNLSPESWLCDYNQVLADLGLQDTVGERRQEMLRTLERCVGTWPGVSAMGRVTYPLDLIQTGDLALAEAMARHVVSENPSFGLGYLSLALVWAAQGEDQRALAAYHSARSHHIGLDYFFDTFFEALCERKDIAAARDHLEEVSRLKIPVFRETAAWVLQAAEKRIHDPGDIETSLAVSNMPLFTEREDKGRDYQDKCYTFASDTIAIQAIWEQKETLKSDARWIDALFDKQKHRPRLAQWLPLHKYFRIVSVEIHSRFAGNTSNAFGIYENLLNQFPFEKTLYDRYDQILLSLNEPAAYVNGWKERSAYNPELAPFAAKKLSEAGKRWYASGNANAAILAYATACELDTEDTHYILRLAQLYDFCCDTEKALHWYRLALLEGANNMDVLDRTAMLSGNLEPPTAVDYWEVLFDILPGHWRVGMLYGAALESAKDYTTAAEVYREMSKYHLGQPDTHLAQSRCLRLSARLSEAHRVLADTLAAHPDTKALAAYELIELGRAFAEKSEFGPAEECYAGALATGEHQALACFSLGEMYLEQGGIGRAVLSLRKAADLDPKNPWRLFVLAQAEETHGDTATALSHYERALRLAPNDATMAEQMDALLAKEDAVEERVRIWRKLVEDYPGNKLMAHHYNEVVKAVSEDFEP